LRQDNLFENSKYCENRRRENCILPATYLRLQISFFWGPKPILWKHTELCLCPDIRQLKCIEKYFDIFLRLFFRFQRVLRWKKEDRQSQEHCFLSTFFGIPGKFLIQFFDNIPERNFRNQKNLQVRTLRLKLFPKLREDEIFSDQFRNPLWCILLWTRNLRYRKWQTREECRCCTRLCEESLNRRSEMFLLLRAFLRAQPGPGWALPGSDPEKRKCFLDWIIKSPLFALSLLPLY